MGAFLGLIILLWMGVAAYVTIKKKEILQQVTLQINENINGSLTIESMEPSLIQGFPGVAVLLKNVVLRDSLYERHKHNLIQAEQIYIAVNSFSLLTGKPIIQSATLENGSIYLYTDSLGYRNIQLFKPGNKGGSGKPKRKFNKIELKNVVITYDNKLKDKLFSFSIKRFKGKISYYPTYWKANVSLNSIVNSLTFRSRNGSFIKGKSFKGDLDLEYSHKTHVLSLPLQEIQIGDDKLSVGGDFSFAPNNSDFSLNIKAPRIAFRNVLTLITARAAKKLQIYNLEKPLSAEAFIKGKLKGAYIPLVNVNWTVDNNRLRLTDEIIEHCSFKGAFTNEYEKGKPRKDPNSTVSLYNLKGNWRGIGFHSDSVKVIDLKDPVLQGQFVSSFPLVKLNQASGSSSFDLKKGTAHVNIFYKAPFNSSSTTRSYINGSVKVTNGELFYVPRNLTFKNVNGDILFRGQDLYLRNFNVRTSFSKLFMEGSILNFTNFYYTNPEKIILDWRVNSPEIDLREFLAFLATRKRVVSTYQKNRIGRLLRQLNNVLEQSSVHMELKSNKLLYKRFTASNAHANLNLNQSGIIIRDVSLKHAGGTLNISGNISQQAIKLNPFTLISKLNNVNIQHLFYAFENFGQRTITNKNIKGNFSALVNVKGLINQSGALVPRSFAGKINFKLSKGALIGFEPMEKVGRFAFPHRDFSNITIGDLSNTLEVKGDKIIIPEMTIMTSVINMIVKGVYGVSNGTNIGLQIPLRNPEKDKDLPDSLKEKRVKRGIVINLTAMDDENGNLKIKLGKNDDEEEEKENKKKKSLKKSEAEKDSSIDSLKK